MAGRMTVVGRQWLALPSTQTFARHARHLSGKKGGAFSEWTSKVKESVEDVKEDKEKLPKTEQKFQDASESHEKARRLSAANTEPTGGLWKSATSWARGRSTAGKDGVSAEPTAQEKRANKDSSAAPAPSGPFTFLVNTFKLLKKELMDDSKIDRRREAAERKLRRDQRVIQEDEETVGVVMHKDSAWQSQWKNFKDNNKVVNGLFNLRLRFEESENVFVRAFRSLADSISEKIGGVFEEGEMSQTMAEIARVDPNFDKDNFLLYCEQTVIPSVLEAYMAGDKKTLRDWCSDACHSFLCARIDERNQHGYKLESRILDIRSVDLLLAKMMDENPLLIMSFMSQQTNCVRDATGAIKEGGEDHIERVYYVFAMRRNQQELDPLLAWQVMEIGVQASMETW